MVFRVPAGVDSAGSIAGPGSRSVTLAQLAIDASGNGSDFLAGDGTFKPGSGGSTVPLPFFGNIPSTGWTRPAGTTFSTWLNQSGDGGTAAALTDNTGGLPLVLRGITDGIGADAAVLTAVLKTIGAPPWTVTVGIASFGNLAATETDPIVLYNATSHKAVAFNWYGASALASGQNNITHYTNTNTPSTATQTQAADSSLSNPFSDYFQWFRVVNDGTNLVFYLSPDGIIFEQFYTETLASFITSVDHVGFGYERTDGSGTNAVNCILWNWVET